MPMILSRREFKEWFVGGRLWRKGRPFERIDFGGSHEGSENTMLYNSSEKVMTNIRVRKILSNNTISLGPEFGNSRRSYRKKQRR